jgi:hypothetical protein
MARRVDSSYVPSDARAPENGYTAKTYRKVWDLLQKKVAEREGFEPSVPF